MKIEKISDKQIRCTVTLADLRGMDLKMNELAYGSAKARSLFREMLTRARDEYGFESHDSPLMVEAIPDANQLVLIITIVDEPDELDMRFSTFTPNAGKKPSESDRSITDINDILELFQNAQNNRSRDTSEAGGVSADDVPEDLPDDISDADFETLTGAAGTAAGAGGGQRRRRRRDDSGDEADTTGRRGGARRVPKAGDDMIRLIEFRDLETVLDAVKALNGLYRGESTLFRRTRTHAYLMSVHLKSSTPEVFNRTCNILSEYGLMTDLTKAAEAHLMEHETVLYRRNAIQKLGTLN